MDKIDKITLKNGNVLTMCVLELFKTLYEKNNKDYDKTITKMGQILCNPFSRFTDQKHKIILYVIAKATELNHYRKKLGIIDDESQDLVRILEESNGSSIITSENFKNSINDALYYLLATNTLFQQDAINHTIENGFNKKLYKVSPVILLEHLATLLEEPSGKELLLESIEEAITIAYEKRIFASKEHPTPKSKHYFLENVRYPSAFHLEVVGQFHTRADIGIEEDEKKVLMCEMAYTFLSKKEASGMSYTHYNLFNKLRSCGKTKIELSRFYDEHNVEIMNCFVGNANSFDILKKDGILEDQEEFKSAKAK